MSVQCDILSKEQLPIRWPVLKAYIDRACEKDIEQKITSGGLYDECMNGSSVAVEITWHEIPCGVAIVSATNIKNGRHLFVQALGGIQMEKWLPAFVDYLETMCKQANCTDGILFVGRPGWARELRRLGFDLVLVTMRKGVNK